MAKSDWIAQVKGEKCSEKFEISVVRESYELGKMSWGWFGNDKLLISHNGGPCQWPLTEKVWNKIVQLAEDVAGELNSEERVVE